VRSDNHPSFAGQLANIAGFFAAVGPPVGGVIWWLSGAVLGLIFRSEPNLGTIKTIVGAFFIGIASAPISYLFGLLPAALAGLLVGAAQLNYGRLPWPVVVLIGFGVGIIDVFIIKGYALLFSDFGYLQSTGLPSFPSLLVPTVACTIATFVCWGFVQNWYIERAASA
jgi:hypothetical protein